MIVGLKESLEHYAVRQMLWEMMDYCQTFGQMGYKDPHLMAIMAGRHDIGTWILSELEQADENVFFKMKKEAKERLRERQKNEEAVEDSGE